MNSNDNIRTVAILLAGGSGTRMSGDKSKQSMLLCGKTVLRRSAESFERSEVIDGIIVVARQSELELVRSELVGISKLRDVVIGGNCRAESAIAGFNAAEPYADLIAIHDVARPLITPAQIGAVVAAAHEFGAATAVSTVTDTVKEVDSDGFIVATHPREALRRAQTPQVFSSAIYREAVLSFTGELSAVTDDNMLVERLGRPIKAVDVGEGNIKLTFMQDIKYAELLLGERNG